jgi:hypothetical protein
MTAPTGIILDRYRYAPPMARQFPYLFGTGSATITTTTGGSQYPTVTDTTNRGMNLTYGTYGSAGLRGCMKLMNAAKNQTIIARLDFPRWGYEYMDCGGLFMSDGTKFLDFVQDYRSSNRGFFIDQWNSQTSYSSEPLSGTSSESIAEMEWFRWDIVNGNPTNWMVSPNGTDWICIYQSTNSWLASCSYIGFGFQVNHNAGDYPVSGTNEGYLNVLYYKDLDIVPTV